MRTASSQSFHPDKNKEDEDAVEKFKEATEAYEVLSDTEKRERSNDMGTLALKAFMTLRISSRLLEICSVAAEGCSVTCSDLAEVVEEHCSRHSARISAATLR